MDMVALHSCWMSVFVSGTGHCDINETTAVTGESFDIADTSAAMYA